jgi:cellulose synthase/poly-beta-1,6-N-acetylglucosamine synthase-like glycosyltransferase
MLSVLFWLCLAALLYTYLGYPLLVFARARAFPRRIDCGDSPREWPTVTVVIAAFNETTRIAARIRNLIASDYSPENIEIIVVSDASTDDTVQQIRALSESRVHALAQTQRSGKAAGLNVGVTAARGEIIVFADVRQQFAPDAIRQLVRHFANPRIGAVSGELEIAGADSSVGRGVDAYWRLEKFIRMNEARRDSCIGCTGAIYAIRRRLFQPLPADTILDDVVVPMQIASQGFRVAFEPAALAFDPQPLEPAVERVRKQRTLAGNYQMLFRYPEWLLPWRHRLWWQLLSHKYLRLAAPFLMLALLAFNVALLAGPLYRVLFAGQGLFYALAGLGIFSGSKRNVLLAVPAGFVFLNIMALRGLWHYLRPPRSPGWAAVPPHEGNTTSNV